MKLSCALFVVCFATYSCFHGIWAEDTPEIFTGQLDDPARPDGFQVPRKIITEVSSGGGSEPYGDSSEGSGYFLWGYQNTPPQNLELISEPVKALPIIVPGLPQDIVRDWEYLGHFGRWARETASFVYYLMSTSVKEMLNLSAEQRTVIDTSWMMKKMEAKVDSIVCVVEMLPLRLAVAILTLIDPRLIVRSVIYVYNFIMEMATKWLHYLISGPSTGVLIFVDAMLFVYAVKMLLQRATFFQRQ